MKKNVAVLSIILASLFAVISCDKEVSKSPVEPEPPQGFVYVKSKPSGFKIYLDDRFTGRFTPDSIPFVEEREHIVALKRKYWRDSSLTVQVTEGNLEVLEVDYLVNKSMRGSINFTSYPEGADIYFDGSLLGETTPFILGDILPGRYNIEYSYPRHRNNSGIVVVESDKTSKVFLTLKDTSIWVDYNTFTTNLPTNKLVAIDVDQSDIIWVGTIDKGIVSFSGSSFRNFNTNNSLLPNDRVLSVFVDSKNNKWIGTEYGLAVIDNNENMTVFTSSNSDLPNNRINGFGEDNQGNIWIASWGGLTKYTNGVFETLNKSNSNIARNQVQAVLPITPSDIWVAVDSNVTHYDGSDFKVFIDTIYNLPNCNMRKLDQSSDNSVWAVFSTQYQEGKGNIVGGISYYDADWHSVLIGGTSTIIYDIYIDRDDKKWVASNQGLLVFTDLATSKAYRPTNSGILSEDIRAIAEDSKGTLWIATGDGLAKYKKYLDTQ